MSPAIQKRSLVIGSLIGFQGLLGWLMVRSGLDPEIEETNSHPRVSHYWLTAHLGSAFVIYSSMLVTGLEILKLHRTSLKPQQVIQKLNSVNSLPMTQFKRAATATAGLVFLTALSGAMVAGLDAGLIYNEFPFMGLGLIPSDMWAFSTESPQNPDPLPWWRNLLENPSAVQFNHRVLAVSTATVIAGLGFYSRRLPLTPHSRLAMNVLLGVTCVQVGLGISTLLYFVPVPLAASHQAGSLTLLSAALWLVHTLRRLPK
jgi:cytochrome c oxidase assembly protein subunit 15